jgi:hypothetical protein
VTWLALAANDPLGRVEAGIELDALPTVHRDGADGGCGAEALAGRRLDRDAAAVLRDASHRGREAHVSLGVGDDGVDRSLCPSVKLVDEREHQPEAAVVDPRDLRQHMPGRHHVGLGAEVEVHPRQHVLGGLQRQLELGEELGERNVVMETAAAERQAMVDLA